MGGSLGPENLSSVCGADWNLMGSLYWWLVGNKELSLHNTYSLIAYEGAVRKGGFGLRALPRCHGNAFSLHLGGSSFGMESLQNTKQHPMLFTHAPCINPRHSNRNHIFSNSGNYTVINNIASH